MAIVKSRRCCANVAGNPYSTFIYNIRVDFDEQYMSVGSLDTSMHIPYSSIESVAWMVVALVVDLKDGVTMYFTLRKMLTNTGLCDTMNHQEEKV